MGSQDFRDRIKELRRVPARELVANPRNWRKHPAAQAQALRAVLEEVGYADVLLAREMPDGRLMLIDGHLRVETTPDQNVPVAGPRCKRDRSRQDSSNPRPPRRHGTNG
jgi:hypothetical protein